MSCQNKQTIAVLRIKPGGGILPKINVLQTTYEENKETLYKEYMVDAYKEICFDGGAARVSNTGNIQTYSQSTQTASSGCGCG